MPAPKPPPYSYEEIDSAMLPPSQRFALWREAHRLPMRADPTDEDGRRDFRIRLRRLFGPAGRFSDLMASPMKLSRTMADCQRDGVDMIGLTLMLERPIEHVFDKAGRSAVVQPGQILVKDFTQVAGCSWPTSAHRGLNLHLPRVTVESAVGRKVESLHGTVLSPNGLAPMLAAQLSTLTDIVPRLSASARAATLEATVAVATTTLRVECGSKPEDEENTKGLFSAALSFIERHLGSRHLNPEFIARQLGCSRAHLYRVFAAHGATVADSVRVARLRRTRELLTGGADRNTFIGDIGFQCGFDDPVHFARLFRQEFGMTPSEARAAGRELLDVSAADALPPRLNRSSSVPHGARSGVQRQNRT
jgi:AraC-like DNA-binding protein